MNHPENIANLFFRSMRNELTGKEKRQLSAWRQAAPANEQLFVFETDPENLRQAMIRTAESKERVFKKTAAYASFVEESICQTKAFPYCANGQNRCDVCFSYLCDLVYDRAGSYPGQTGW